jgi:hypothetical protein
MDTQNINRQAINQEYINILEGEGVNKPSIAQKVQILKALTELNGLALSKTSTPEGLRSMSMEELNKFIQQTKTKLIDVTPVSDATPRPHPETEGENVYPTPRKNFKKTDSLGWRLGDGAVSLADIDGRSVDDDEEDGIGGEQCASGSSEECEFQSGQSGSGLCPSGSGLSCPSWEELEEL